MKIGILSDLHLEFSEWDFVEDPSVDLYICAGDIHSTWYEREAWLDRHPNMFWIRGNHDYYHQNFVIDECSGFSDKNINVAGATLWTEFKSPLDWILYCKGLIDMRFINFMSEGAYNDAFKLQKNFLMNSEADIIVSHHAPTLKSIHEKYKGDQCNFCFASDLEEEILNMEYPPKLWIHGHVHNPFDYMVGNTRVICHPRGYPNENELFIDYQPKIVEIEI